MVEFHAGPPDAPDTCRDGTLFISDESGPQRRPEGRKGGQIAPKGTPKSPRDTRTGTGP